MSERAFLVDCNFLAFLYYGVFDGLEVCVHNARRSELETCVIKVIFKIGVVYLFITVLHSIVS